MRQQIEVVTGLANPATSLCLYLLPLPLSPFSQNDNNNAIRMTFNKPNVFNIDIWHRCMRQQGCINSFEELKKKTDDFEDHCTRLLSLRTVPMA